MIKYLFLFFISISTFLVAAQDISEDYLDSLPVEIREDVLSKIDSKEDSEKPVYRKASTMTDKGSLKNSKVFGSNFFDQMQSSFMPINEPNLGSEYILDFGDVLEVQIVGQNDVTKEYLVGRDGSINLMDIGKVFLAGLSLEEASLLIKNKISNVFIGADAFVSLTNIRDIQVLITGNAFNPGIFTLNGNSNVLHALAMAGGVGDNGSYRDIRHIRNNKVIDQIDLYEIFILGYSNFGKKLRSGDSIVIGPSKIVVNSISGVNRPGFYEMKENETFDDLIQFSNGLNSNARGISEVESVTNDGDIIKSSYNIGSLSKVIVKNNDALIIEENIYGQVTLNGAINNPGTYKIRPGETLSQILIRVGGYRKDAYPFGGFLNNKRALALSETAKEKLYESFISNMVSNPIQINDGKSQLIALLTDQIKSSKPSGRVIAEFDLDILSAKPDLDTYLEDGDEIFIPAKTQQVYIFGDVAQEGAVRYVPNANMDKYLSMAGNILETADKKQIFIVYPNGETYRYNSSSSILSIVQVADNNELIYPGSIIYVPKKADIGSNLLVAQIWAPIISGLALSLASLNALNN